MAPVIRVVTRGSALALTQTKQTVELLQQHNPDCTFSIVTLSTTGDRVTDRPLSQFRGTGVFVKELQKALLAGEADIAVHSLKDVPTEQIEGLTLAAFPARKNPHDLLLTNNSMLLDTLPPSAVIGTSSPRRMVQLKALRPDLQFKDLRGNVDTRLNKLAAKEYDAIVAAAAGMIRLGRSFDAASELSFDRCLPAAGQGCLAIETRSSDDRSIRIVSTIDDRATRAEVTAERGFLTVIGGGCHTPVAVYAKISDGMLTITGVIGDPVTARLVKKTLTVNQSDYHSAGRTLAQQMIVLCKENSVEIQQ